MTGGATNATANVIPNGLLRCCLCCSLGLADLPLKLLPVLCFLDCLLLLMLPPHPLLLPPQRLQGLLQHLHALLRLLQ